MPTAVPMLTAGLVAVGLVGLANLLLLVALLRRLREGGITDPSTETWRAPQDMHGLTEGTGPTVHGEAMTMQGVPLRTNELGAVRPTLVGFFSPGCSACKEQLPAFRELAATWGEGRRDVVAVVVDDLTAAAEIGETLTDVARVALDGVEGSLQLAYGVTAFPAFGVLGEAGVVQVAGHSVADLTHGLSTVG